MKKSIFVSTLVAATALAVPAFAADLTWSGDSGSDWTADGVWNGSTWTNDDNAIFGSTSGTTTVTVTGTVTAGSVTIQEGGSYTFDISNGVTLTTGTLANSGSLALTGSGTIVTGNSSDANFAIDATEFTGTLEITGGRFDLGNSAINSDLTIVLDAGTPSDNDPIVSGTATSLFFGNVTISPGSYYQFVSNLVISGNSDEAAMIRTSGTNVEFTGSITSEAAELQLNGGSNVIFSGTVDLAKYIVYQGNTTFSGSSINIGTLELASDNAAYSTTFSASATVGTLETAERSFQATVPADSLVVNNNATLTIGEIVLAYEIDLTTTDGGSAVVTGNVTTSGDGKLVINEGSTLTATGATADGVAALQGIAGEGTLSIEGTAKDTIFTVTTDDSFSGTVDVQQGYLRLEGTSIASDASLVLQASAGTETTNGTYENTDVSIQYGANGQESLDVELANDITLEGTGGVIIRSVSSAYSGTFSGDISAADTDAAYLQLNGGGSAIFTGDITLTSGGYINYQGSTTFTGEVILGSLAIYQPDANANTVTFTGEEAAADIGTLTIHASEGSVAANLAVTDDAVVRVADLVINHDVDITIDGGMLYIDDSVTGSSSVSVTISGGGTLLLGDDVTLNAATISIVLGTDNMDEDYALIGGTVTSTAAIAITVDSAVAGILAEEGTYTFNIYSSDMELSEGAFDLSALDPYGTVTWNGDGTITIAVGAIPEPSMFGLMFGLGAIGLVATRRRRRA